MGAQTLLDSEMGQLLSTTQEISVIAPRVALALRPGIGEWRYVLELNRVWGRVFATTMLAAIKALHMDYLGKHGQWVGDPSTVSLRYCSCGIANLVALQRTLCLRRYARVNTESMTAELLPVSQYLQFKVRVCTDLKIDARIVNPPCTYLPCHGAPHTNSMARRSTFLRQCLHGRNPVPPSIHRCQRVVDARANTISDP